MDINQYLLKNPRSSQFGAPIGASDYNGFRGQSYKFQLCRLRMVDGCYTLDGTYWGGPDDLYCAWDFDALDTQGREGVRMFIRAPSREAAKKIIVESYPYAKFYR